MSRPFQANNRARTSNFWGRTDLGFEDPPPEYSSAPPSFSTADGDTNTANVPLQDTRTSRPRGPIITMIPRIIHVPHIIASQDQSQISNSTNYALNGGINIPGIDERTATLINGVIDAGVALIGIIGTLFSIIYRHRLATREKRAQRKEFEKWKAQGALPQDETFVFAGADGKGGSKKATRSTSKIKKREFRHHARDWQKANLDNYRR